MRAVRDTLKSRARARDEFAGSAPRVPDLRIFHVIVVAVRPAFVVVIVGRSISFFVFVLLSCCRFGMLYSLLLRSTLPSFVIQLYSIPCTLTIASRTKKRNIKNVVIAIPSYSVRLMCGRFVKKSISIASIDPTQSQSST